MRKGSSNAGLRVESTEAWVGHSREGIKSKESLERHAKANRYFSPGEELKWHNPCGGNWSGDIMQTKVNEVDALKKVKLSLNEFKPENLYRVVTNRANLFYYYFQLQLPVYTALIQINQTRQHFQQNDLQRWAKHANYYLFLPTLVSNIHFYIHYFF